MLREPSGTNFETYLKYDKGEEVCRLTVDRQTYLIGCMLQQRFKCCARINYAEMAELVRDSRNLIGKIEAQWPNNL